MQPSASVSRVTFGRLAIVFLISAVLVLPCLWLPLVEAGDFSSHVYNAWLVQEIEAGKVQGVWIATQRTNVLFDLLLSGLVQTVGFDAGQKVSICILVLTFAWGAFVLAQVVSGRPPWFLLPCIAMLAYGWVFHMGFNNFHLALGISLWALALLWRGGRWRAAGAVALLSIAATAHALPVAWACAAAFYGWIARRLTVRGRLIAGGAIVASIFAARLVLMSKFVTLWMIDQPFSVTGVDQLWVYGVKYVPVSLMLLLFWVSLIERLLNTEGARATFLSIPFQMYLFTAAFVVLIPTRVQLPGYEHDLGYISFRMSLAGAVAFCVAAASARPAKWQTVGMGAVACLFFSFLFVDARALNRLEWRMAETLRQLPSRSRVVGAACNIGGRTDPLLHMVDRACAGHCFSYANYEPCTAAFRVRVNFQDGVVMSRYRDSFAVQTGEYRVRKEDLPLYQVYFCKEGSLDLCVRPLEANQVTGRTCRPVTPGLW